MYTVDAEAVCGGAFDKRSLPKSVDAATPYVGSTAVARALAVEE